jgi:hypothetical protein
VFLYVGAVKVAARVVLVSFEKAILSIADVVPPPLLSLPPSTYPAVPLLAIAPDSFLGNANVVPRVETASLENTSLFIVVDDDWPIPVTYPATPLLDIAAASCVLALRVAAKVLLVSAGKDIFSIMLVAEAASPPAVYPALGAIGVTELEAEEALDVPFALVAVTVNV